MSDLQSDSVDVASLRADQRRRWQSGERVCVEEYLTDYPELVSDPDRLLDLIYNEVLLREESGEQPKSEDYISRFPALEIALRDQFEVHEIIIGSHGSTNVLELECEIKSTDSLSQIDPRVGNSYIDKLGVSQIPITTNRYKLREEIARGGMGMIYRATDTAFGREIAIKVLQDRFDSCLTAVRRFADEARITGQLQHPSIPPAHDLGILPDGRLFLAMKLVQGRTFDVILAERPDPSFEQGRFVAVFEQVCQAIAYAHAHQVIHRDLKPANVMVGNYGEVQVMDWGLAKVLNDREQPHNKSDEPVRVTGIRSLRDIDGSITLAGNMLGTPAFMPPEQAMGMVGKVDAQSDVFGLGAVLAVILTGVPPFNGASAETTRIQAAQGMVDDCYSRLDQCRADPDLIGLCKRCLSPEKERRPVDGGEVAKAVAELRAAADERAKRAELDRVTAESERAAALLTAAELRKRRKVQLLLAAMIVVVLATTGAFAWYSDRQATVRRMDEENRKREEQDRHGRNAEAVTVLLDRCVAALLANNAAKANVALEAAEKRVAEGGAEELTGRMEHLRADLAVLMDLDASDEFRWTPLENKVPAREKVTARFREILRRFGADPDSQPPDVSVARVTNSALRDRLVAALDRILVGEKSNRVRTVLQLADPDPYRDAVRDATICDAHGSLTELAQQHRAVEQPPRFVAILGENWIIPVERRRELLERAILRQPGDLGLLMSLGSTYPVNHREGADQRVRWFQVALGINPTNMGARINLGSALLDLGDLAGAEAQNREAIRLEPNNALSHHNLGWVLYNRGNLSSAEEEYLEAIRLDPNSALSHNNLGLILDRSGNLAAAEIKYREAIRLDPKLAIPHNFLAWLAVRKNDLRLAELEYREALRLDSTYYHSHNGLGWVLEKKGDWDGAETEYRKTIQLEPRYALAHCNLGRMLDRKKVEDGAEVEYRQAIRYDANLKEPHFHLGVLLRQKGDLAGAEAEFRAAIRLDRNDPHPHNSLGYLFQYFTGDLKRAIAEYEEALKLDPMFSAAANNLASAVRMQALLKRLPDILVGKSAPTTPTEACEFASLCRQRFLKRFAAAVRLYDGAFNADTAITSDLIANNRYDAACLAALAARGEGADSPEDAEGRTTLRTKALAWLRAELVHHKKQAISPNITERKAATDALSHWLKDKDFSRLRPTEARIEMSSKERADWDALWIEVRATIAEAPKSGPS